MKSCTVITAFVVLTAASCSDDLPKEKLNQFPFNPVVSETADSLWLSYENKVACPISFKVNTNFPDSTGAYTNNNPIIVEPYGKLEMKFKKPDLAEKPKEYFSFNGSRIGNPNEVNIDTAFRYEFPFPLGRTYEIMQGYNGKFSHQSPYSKYAIDFTLAVGDTVCAARDGIVVGLIEGYNVGGKSKKYRDYANFITLYHPDGTLTQYVHLKQDGALVALGDTVKALQPIGISGATGYTSSPHLHFNVLKPTPDGADSFPIKFSTIPGDELRRGVKVNH